MKLLTLASLLSLPLAACTSDTSGTSSSDITTAEYDDVAQNVGTTAASPSGGDVAVMADVALVASGTLPLGFTLGANGSVTGSFLGITYDFSVTCSDAQGTHLPTCGSATQLADVKLDWSGALQLPNFSTTMDRHGDWSLMNLEDPSVKLAGNGTFSFDSSISNPNTTVTTAYHFDYAAAYTAVFIDKTTKLATAGEIQYDISASKMVTGAPDRTFALSADVTFNGDGTATIDLDGMHHYKLDLTTHAVIKID
ncbi:MAG: hypothetical protein ABI591_13720 [Kofleriaceae bacterium]